MEEQWNAETEELRSKLKKLQDENQKLKQKLRNIASKSSASSASSSSKGENSLENLAGALYTEEYKTNKKLREQLQTMEAELKFKSKELEVKEAEVQDLVGEIEEMKVSHNQMRRMSRAMETQVKSLYEEREEILAEMNRQDKTFVVLRDHLGMAQVENESLAWRALNDDQRPRFTLNEMNDVLRERNALIEKVKELEEELRKFNHQNQVESGKSLIEIESSRKFKNL